MKACIAVIGAGGKTTAVRSLAHRLSGFSVLWTTTTHIYPAAPGDCRLLLRAPAPDALAAALGEPGIVCAGTPAGEKLTALSPEGWAVACKAADYIVYEPVLPAGTTHVLIVLGLSALGRPVGEVVHRYALHPAWAAHPAALVGVAELCLCAEEAAARCGVPKENIRLLFNQVDDKTRMEAGQQAAGALSRQGFACRVGALQKDDAFLAPWVLGE